MDMNRRRGRDMDVSDLPEVVQHACRASIRRTLTFYGEDTVDSQMTHDQVRLCGATAEYVYDGYTPLKVGYQAGTRPELEGFAAEALGASSPLKKSTKQIDVAQAPSPVRSSAQPRAAGPHFQRAGRAGERERVLSILRFVRDIPTRRPGGRQAGVSDLFHGGTEEEVIKKCSGMCNEQARVFCVLCQVAGIPSRYVGHYVGGHGVSEAFVEGRWAYFDIRGKYFLKPDGTLASTWDLVRDPSLIDSQPPEVRADILDGYDLQSTRRYFSPVEVTVLTNYFAWERGRYGFGWIWNTPELQARVAEVRKEFPEALSAENVLLMLDGKKAWPT